MVPSLHILFLGAYALRLKLACILLNFLLLKCQFSLKHIKITWFFLVLESINGCLSKTIFSFFVKFFAKAEKAWQILGKLY